MGQSEKGQDNAAPKKQRFTRIRGLTKSVTGWNAVTDGRQTVSSLYDTAFKDNKKRAILHETFEESVSRQSLNANDIANAAKRQRIMALVFYGAATLASMSALYSMLFGHGSGGRIIGFLSFFPGILLFVIGYSAAFRHWQIRERRLGGYEIYSRNPMLWWPREVGAAKSRGVTVVDKNSSGRGAVRPK